MPSNIYLPLAKTPIVALVVESREAARRRGGAQAVLHASAVPSARWNPCIDSTRRVYSPVIVWSKSHDGSLPGEDAGPGHCQRPRQGEAPRAQEGAEEAGAEARPEAGPPAQV